MRAAVAAAAVLAVAAAGTATAHNGEVTVTCDDDTAAITAVWQSRDNWTPGVDHTVTLYGEGGKPDGTFQSGGSFSGVLAAARFGYVGPVTVQVVAVDGEDGYVYRRTATRTVSCPDELVPPVAPEPPENPVPPATPPVTPPVVVTPPVDVPAVVNPPRRITCATLRKVGAGPRYLRKYGCVKVVRPNCRTLVRAIRNGAGPKWRRVAVRKGCIPPPRLRVPGVRIPAVTG